jgi:hypothetical protein
MNTDITGRGVSLLAGVISALGGLGILLEDVMTGSTAFELKHGIVIGIVALAILAGHSVTAAWRARSVFGVVGFLVVFLAATGLVVVKSTGRQAEHTFQSQAEADFAAEERARIKPLLAADEKRTQQTQDQLDTDCVKGKRGKGHCDGLRATLGVYTAAVKGHKADLARLGPPKLGAPDAENFAELAAVFGWDKAKVKAATILLVPFLTTALFEFGAIVGFFFAFRHRAITETTPSKDLEKEAEDFKKITANDPGPPLPPTKMIVPDVTGAAIIPWAKRFEQDNGRPARLDEVQAAFPEVARTTAYRRLKAA